MAGNRLLVTSSTICLRSATNNALDSTIRASVPSRVVPSKARSKSLRPRTSRECSCQDLAPTTHVYTSPEKRGKALLEWGCKGMQRIEADADQPSASPPRDSRHRVHFLEQAHPPIAL